MTGTKMTNGTRLTGIDDDNDVFEAKKQEMEQQQLLEAARREEAKRMGDIRRKEKEQEEADKVSIDIGAYKGHVSILHSISTMFLVPLNVCGLLRRH